MPKKYDDQFKARAVRLVTDHVEEYDSRTACVVAVAKRLSIAPETLRRWINQIDVDAGVRDGVPTEITRENRELRRKNRELEETVVIFSRCRRVRRDQGVCVVDGVFDVASRVVRS